MSAPDTQKPSPRRAWAYRLRPALLPASLLAAGIALGGIPGFLAGFVGGLLGLDRVLERAIGPAGAGSGEARRRFDGLARERRRRRDDDGLAYLPDDTGWASVAERRGLGVQAVDVASITGTVDAHKAVAFDASFRPPAYSRERWIQLYRAARGGAALPPISVYRVGREHFVRDGHHRVSVARALGAAQVDADVVELRRAA